MATEFVVFRKVHNDVRVDPWRPLTEYNNGSFSSLKEYLSGLYFEDPELDHRTYSHKILEDKHSYQYYTFSDHKKALIWLLKYNGEAYID